MLRFVSHLVVGVVIILLSISLVYIGSTLSSGNWAAAAITAFLIVITAQYLKPVKVPVPVLSLSQRKFTVKRFPFFRAFPLFFTLFLVWLLCFLLTVSGLLDGEAGWKKAIRTDTNTYALSKTPWLMPPYPLQWGTPTFSVSAIFGMITGVLAGTIDTIGDYYACARLSGAPRPPVHAMNRAIAAEGLGNLMSALWGCGTGTTSYSANIGLIGATKVGSRRVVQAAGLWMIIFGLVGKVGALFATVPKPVIGGIYLYVVGFMMSAALSELQYVELQRSRNLFVLGFSLATGLGIPNWIEKYPSAISTGSVTVDHILLVLFGSTIFVGGLVAMILENTLQDADKPEPPLELTPLGAATIRKTYDLPVCQRSLRTIRCMRYLPFSPSFSGFVFKKPSARLSSITESDT